MQTHRVMHEFGELSYEDLGEISRRSLAKTTQAKTFPLVLAAVAALGLFIGYLARRK